MAFLECLLGGGEGWIQLMTALLNQQLDQCVAIP